MTDLSPITGGTVPDPPSAEVTAVRRLLGEAGEQYYHVIKEEFGLLVPEANGSYSVYTKRRGVHQVVGIYLATDINKTLNYYVGLGSIVNPDGGFNEQTGVITLSNNYSYPNTVPKVIIDYVHKEGLSNEDIETIIAWSKSFVRQYTAATPSFTQESDNWWALISIAKFACLMLLNTGSVLQAGYNIRIEEFAVETKAWGEGMIAQFLLVQFKEEVNEILANVGWGVRIAIANRTKQFEQDSPRRTLVL